MKILKNMRLVPGVTLPNEVREIVADLTKTLDPKERDQVLEKTTRKFVKIERKDGKSTLPPFDKKRK